MHSPAFVNSVHNTQVYTNENTVVSASPENWTTRLCSSAYLKRDCMSFCIIDHHDISKQKDVNCKETRYPISHPSCRVLLLFPLLASLSMQTSVFSSTCLNICCHHVDQLGILFSHEIALFCWDSKLCKNLPVAKIITGGMFWFMQACGYIVHMSITNSSLFLLSGQSALDKQDT